MDGNGKSAAKDGGAWKFKEAKADGGAWKLNECE